MAEEFADGLDGCAGFEHPGGFTRALAVGVRPSEVTTDRAPAFPRVLDEQLPAALHVAEQYANNPIEADHSRLKARYDQCADSNDSGPRRPSHPVTRSSRTCAAFTTKSPATSQPSTGWPPRSPCSPRPPKTGKSKPSRDPDQLTQQRPFNRSAMYPLLLRTNAYLMRWLRRKYRRQRPFKKAKACWQRIVSQQPRLFAHWAWIPAFW